MVTVVHGASGDSGTESKINLVGSIRLNRIYVFVGVDDFSFWSLDFDRVKFR
jgi:hypothetical protein